MRKQLLALLVCAAAGQAGSITGVGPATGSITLGCPCFVSTTAINNDNVLGVSPNIFGFGITVNGFGSYSHPLTGPNTLGVTEYEVTVAVTNNTALPIIGWTFGLPGSPYDFDAPDFDSPDTNTAGWAIGFHTDSALDFDAGLPLATGATMSFTMAIDVPDCSLPLPACNFTSTPRFGLAASPEPATLFTLGAPLLALLIYGKRRKSAQRPCH